MPRRLIERDSVKRDLLVAVAAILIVFGVSFALAKARPDLPLTPSEPPARKVAGTDRTIAPNDKIVMRVNGEPITEREFNAFLTALPEAQRDMFAAPQGRRILASEIVRMKALEQEARRLGIADDPQLAAQFSLLRTQIMAQRALEKLVTEKADAQVRAMYEQEKNKTRSLRHIVIAYEGSMVPPKDGTAPSAAEATAEAGRLVTQLRGGAEFAQLAQAHSDDAETAARGGYLGPLQPGGLPPELDAVVSQLQPGEVSEPVRTQFGIHIFSVAPPSLDDMRPMLTQRVQQQVAQEEVQKLEQAATVDLDPAFFGPPPPASQPQVVPSANPSEG